jgi:DNA-binding HxlR family transcriptional regulator
MLLLGGAWTPHIVWSLSADARRFSELRADVSGISSKVLAARLRSLEENGVVTRTLVATSPPSVEYALTDLGRELLPVIESIDRVGRRLRRIGAVPMSRRWGWGDRRRESIKDA